LGGDTGVGGIFTGGANTNIGFVVGDSGSANNYLLTGTTNLLVDRWYHIACVWDINATSPDPNMLIFINGVLEASYDFSTAMNSARQGTGQLRLGMQNATSVYFDGRIDEVRIWDVARNQTQIRANMCRKVTPRASNLVGYWRFDEETTSPTTYDFGTAPYNTATMYNFGTAGDIILTARVCSEAPIGDASAYGYGTTTSSSSANLTTPVYGDSFHAREYTTGGGWGNPYSGIQIYRVDGPPVYPPDLWDDAYHAYTTPNGLTPPYPPNAVSNWSSIDYYRYWGVFLTDWTDSPTYDVIYNYTGNPSVPDDADKTDPTTPQIGLAKRDFYCDQTWEDSGAYWDFATLQQLELTGARSLAESQNGPPKIYPEYILGGINQPLAIVLAAFNAVFKDGCIEIFWETATEIDTLGFQLWRSEHKDGPYSLVLGSYTASNSVIETMGARYSFTDCDAVLDGKKAYYYKLEEIQMDNDKDNPFYGPIGPVSETVAAAQPSAAKGSKDKACFISVLMGE
jgi:hypothetical protein